MRSMLRRLVTSAVVAAGLAAAGPARAGEALPVGIRVSSSSAETRWVVKGRVLPAAEPGLPAPVTLRLGDHVETLAPEELETTRSGWRVARARDTSGIRGFRFKARSGRFVISGGGVPLGALDLPVTMTLDIGGSRSTGRYVLAGRGGKRSWKRGGQVFATLKGQVFRASRRGGQPLVATVPGTTFVRNDSQDQEAVIVGGDDVVTGFDGRFAVEISFTDPAVLGRLDVGALLGHDEAGALTRPGSGRAVVTGDGVVEVVTLLRRRGSAAAVVLASADAAIEVPAGAHSAGGLLFLPAGSVPASPGQVTVTFDPWALPAELPAPLPPGFVALAGADVGSSPPLAFAKGAVVTVDLGRPAWVDPTALATAEIRLLQYAEGAWSVRPGRAVHDEATDRIVPDVVSPATLAAAAPVAYAVVVSAETASHVRGRVRDGAGAPRPGAAVLSRCGALVADAAGRFEVPRSVFRPSAMEIVQTLGTASSSARALAAGEVEDETVVLTAEVPAPVTPLAGSLEGVVYEPDGTTPSPGAAVTIGLTGALAGLDHVDAGSPADFSDDEFRVADLAVFGVETHEWAILFPGAPAEFVSTGQTGASVRPYRDLVLEAQDAGATVVQGVYTVRCSFDLPGWGPVDLFAGFRVDFRSNEFVVTDIQLPAAVEGFEPILRTTNAEGRFSAGLVAPPGVPFTVAAVNAGGTARGEASFAFATEVTQDVVLVALPSPPSAQPHWETLRDLPEAMAGHGAAAVGTLVHVIGSDGKGSYRYDLATDSWAPNQPLPGARSRFATAAVGGKIYVMGGMSAGTPTSLVQVYDPVADSWSTGVPMSEARAGAAVAVFAGRIYVFGGEGASAYLASVESFDPATGEWNAHPPMAVARADAVAGAMPPYIHVHGGRVGEFAEIGDTVALETFRPATASWFGPWGLYPDGLIGRFGGVVDGLLITFGGWDGGPRVYNEVWDQHGIPGGYVDPDNDTCCVPVFPRARWLGASTVVGKRLLTFGGYDGNQAATRIAMALRMP